MNITLFNFGDFGHMTTLRIQKLHKQKCTVTAQNIFHSPWRFKQKKQVIGLTVKHILIDVHVRLVNQLSPVRRACR